MNDETMISAEELFGESATGNAPAPKGRARGKKSAADLFTEAKIKMVMRIYGVPRKGALGIIACRKAGDQDSDGAKKRQKKHSGENSEAEFMTAEEFFGIEE